MIDETHHRRSTRLPEFDYSQPGAYFITICTFEKQLMFGEVLDGEMQLNEYGTIVQQIWNALPSHYEIIELGPFVIMPNHVHGIINIHEVGAIHELPLPSANDRFGRRKMILPMAIGYFKMNAAKSINLLRHTPGQPVWQRNYYEHIIRGEQDMQKINEYIFSNPSTWENDKFS